MKPELFLFIPIFLATFACGHKAGSNSDLLSTDTTSVEKDPEALSFQCYESLSNQDTFRLRVEKFENKVTGTLAYLFHDKDKNFGDYEGKMHGDTLIADYIFYSEGSSSVRQVAFLLKDQKAIEGYGPMAEQDGKTIFTNMKSVSFGKGVVMSKQDCPPSSKEDIAHPNDLTGTWELNFITGTKIAFDALYPDKKPLLVFASTAPDEFSGHTSCNSVRGKFHANDTAIKFEEPLAMTKMKCQGDGEQAFLNMLGKVNILDLKSKSLSLLIDDVEVMRFSRK